MSPPKANKEEVCEVENHGSEKDLFLTTLYAVEYTDCFAGIARLFSLNRLNPPYMSTVCQLVRQDMEKGTQRLYLQTSRKG